MDGTLTKLADVEVTPDMRACAESVLDDFWVAGGPDATSTIEMVLTSFRLLATKSPQFSSTQIRHR